jgi:hypothetical protein
MSMTTQTMTTTAQQFTGLIRETADGTILEITSGTRSYSARVYKNFGGRFIQWIGCMPPSSGIQVARQIARIR